MAPDKAQTWGWIMQRPSKHTATGVNYNPVSPNSATLLASVAHRPKTSSSIAKNGGTPKPVVGLQGSIWASGAGGTNLNSSVLSQNPTGASVSKASAQCLDHSMTPNVRPTVPLKLEIRSHHQESGHPSAKAENDLLSEDLGGSASEPRVPSQEFNKTSATLNVPSQMPAEFQRPNETTKDDKPGKVLPKASTPPHLRHYAPDTAGTTVSSPQLSSGKSPICQNTPSRSTKDDIPLDVFIPPHLRVKKSSVDHPPIGVSGPVESEAETEIRDQPEDEKAKHIQATQAEDKCQRSIIDAENVLDTKIEVSPSLRSFDGSLFGQNIASRSTHSMDIRGALELEVRDPKQHDQDWNVTARDLTKRQKEAINEENQMSDEENAAMTSMAAFIKSWINHVPLNVQAHFLTPPVDEHYKCDIDPMTGNLLEPVAEPQTTIDASQQIPHLILKQQRQTAAHSMEAKLRRIQKLEAKRIREEEIAQEHEQRTAAIRAEEEREREMARWDTTIPCHFRPACVEDMESVALIYNNEVRQSYSASDTKSLSWQGFARILDSCTRDGRPFLVSVEGFYDGSNSSTTNGGIIGFAFLDIETRGLLGSYDTNATMVGKTVVVVSPEYRRKHIATAFLDIIFATCSVLYVPKERGYQLVNHQDNPIYRSPHWNPRKWNHIVLEFYFPSAESKEKLWENNAFDAIKEWVADEMRAWEHYHTWRIYENPRSPNSWLDKVVFRHQCRLTESFIGSNPSAV